MSNRILKVIQHTSSLKYDDRYKQTLRSLGFTKKRKVIYVPNNSNIRGMLSKVIHLVTISVYN